MERKIAIYLVNVILGACSTRLSSAWAKDREENADMKRNIDSTASSDVGCAMPSN